MKDSEVFRNATKSEYFKIHFVIIHPAAHMRLCTFLYGFMDGNFKNTFTALYTSGLSERHLLGSLGECMSHFPRLLFPATRPKYCSSHLSFETTSSGREADPALSAKC